MQTNTVIELFVSYLVYYVLFYIKKRMHYDFYRSKMMSLSEMHNVVVCI